ncbi:hypothetical protein BG653_02983 [Streptomyces platensis]|uniref:Uncharacterized protein n=1 Tax=Streptomyces platensis TaxID=58346 RepID=A0ABX3XXV6_STRPT|nr:hypothetical protein BG653_02983 [Streptomyces platensis]
MVPLAFGPAAVVVAGPAGVAVDRQHALAVRYLVGAVAVERVPGQHRAQIRVGVVVAEDRPVQVGLSRQIAVAGAEIAARGERRIEDVVGVLLAVAVAVSAPTGAVGAAVGPGGRDELHRAHGAVVGEVAVIAAGVGVGDPGEAVAVELRAEYRTEGGALGVDRAAARLAGLDLADPGEQLPGQPAARVGGVDRGRGLLVRGQDGGGEAGLGGPPAGGGALAGVRRTVRRHRALEGRQVGVVRGTAVDRDIGGRRGRPPFRGRGAGGSRRLRGGQRGQHQGCHGRRGRSPLEPPSECGCHTWFPSALPDRAPDAVSRSPARQLRRDYDNSGLASTTRFTHIMI